MKLQKHHFVPKVYLKRFSINTGDLYALQIKPKIKSTKIKTMNYGQVCYERDRYRLEDSSIVSMENSDEYIVEKSAFTYEPKLLSELFDKIDYRKDLTQSEIKSLLQILFSIIRRNPKFGENFTSERISKTLVKEIMKLESEMQLTPDFKEKFGSQVESAISKLKKKSNTSEYAKDIYNSLLLNISRGDLPEEKARINELSKCKFHVLQTNYNCPFITSDNPGFTVKNGKEFYNTEFGFVQEFGFPISPRSLLLIKLKEQDEITTIVKKITYQQISPNNVNYYNLGTSFLANKQIFAQFKDQLEITRQLLLKNAA